jgi:hypothetical protein
MAKQNKGELAEKLSEIVEGKYSFGATAITADRKAGLSWAKIADKRDLGSPGAARRAFTVLTGKPHTEAPQLDRGGRPAGSGNGGVWTPVDVAELTTIAAVRKAIAGQVCQVQPIRKGGQVRSLGAMKVQKLDRKAKDPTVDLVGADGTAHTVRLDKITAVRPVNGG